MGAGDNMRAENAQVGNPKDEPHGDEEVISLFTILGGEGDGMEVDAARLRGFNRAN